MQRSTIIATNDSIRQIVKDEISKYGEDADLNHIDVSKVTNMVWVFNGSAFNGDISKWDVSNVKDMSCMFQSSEFNGDISRWDVSNVKSMRCMFEGSSFKGDLSTWLLHPNCDVDGMMHRIKKRIIPPLLQLDCIDEYRKTFDKMFGDTNKWSTRIPKNPCIVTAHHLALLLLLPDHSPKTIHTKLTEEDTLQLQMLYQLTNSVHQSVTIWEQQRHRQPMADTCVASALCN
jgi:surface protein